MKYQNLKKVITGVGLAVVMVVPMLSMAADLEHGHRHAHKGRMMGHNFERLADELALTEGQKAQIRADRDAARSEHRDLAQQQRELHQQIRTALDDGADQATLDTLAAQVGALEVQKMQQRRENRAQFLAVLTDDQKAKLTELKQERMDKRQQRMERHLERMEQRKEPALNS